jgi:hypothetical protein
VTAGVPVFQNLMHCVISWKVACETAKQYKLFNRYVVYNGRRHNQEADGNR